MDRPQLAALELGSVCSYDCRGEVLQHTCAAQEFQAFVHYGLVILEIRVIIEYMIVRGSLTKLPIRGNRIW